MVAPDAPQLSTPSNDKGFDVRVANKFRFDSRPVGTYQEYYAFRRKVVGASTYEYWNATTNAWSTTEVKNHHPLTDTQVMYVEFPANSWNTTNGTSYNWSAKTWNSADEVGPYATDYTAVANDRPTVTVNGPTGSITTTQSPTVAWTFSDTEADGQYRYRIRIYPESVYTGTGFKAGQDSGTVYAVSVVSGNKEEKLDVPLENGSYRTYMEVTDWMLVRGDWTAGPDFSIAVNLPVTPTISVTPQPELGRVKIELWGHENMLTAAQSSFETSVGYSGWGARTPVVRTLVDTLGADGSISMKIADNTTDAVAGDMIVDIEADQAFPVVAGESYTAYASFRDNGTVRNVRMDVEWYSVGDTLISTGTGTAVSEVLGTWVEAREHWVAPAGANEGRLVVTYIGVADGESHFLDKISIAPDQDNSLTEWSIGETLYTSSFHVERRDPGSKKWVDVRGGEAKVGRGYSQYAVVYDYEAPPGVSGFVYRARVNAEILI